MHTEFLVWKELLENICLEYVNLCIYLFVNYLTMLFKLRLNVVE
jgi:hypothetical protein